MRQILLILLCQLLIFFHINVYAGNLKVTAGKSDNFKKAYFAGGCFWCMEESYDQVKGVLSSISGYSGGHLKNPKYEDVIYKDTGHVEVVEITYDPSVVSFKSLLEVYWKNIDPFDKEGQFCDKGKSYRSVIFFENKSQKELIDRSFKELEKKFDKKVATLVWKFEIFYPAENYHQDYYEKNFIRYLMYKNACKREDTLKKIWN